MSKPNTSYASTSKPPTPFSGVRPRADGFLLGDGGDFVLVDESGGRLILTVNALTKATGAFLPVAKPVSAFSSTPKPTTNWNVSDDAAGVTLDDMEITLDDLSIFLTG